MTEVAAGELGKEKQTTLAAFAGNREGVEKLNQLEEALLAGLIDQNEYDEAAKEIKKQFNIATRKLNHQNSKSGSLWKKVSGAVKGVAKAVAEEAPCTFDW